LTNLATAIGLAQERNEQKLAAQIPTPKGELDAEALLWLKYFSGYCRDCGVKFCPARPATVAAWIRRESGRGLSEEEILAALRAIEQVHDQSNEANPVATSAVRAELGRILEIKAPRSWKKSEALIFNTLPIEVQQIVARRAEQDSLVLRRLQNKVAELAKKGNLQCQPENKSTADSTDSKPTTQSS
jgi:hypothetical protein